MPAGSSLFLIAFRAMPVLRYARGHRPSDRRVDLAILRRLCRQPRCRQQLRRCPLCESTAVGVYEYETVDGQPRIRQQCGQCGVWREIVATVSEAARHERTLEADRTEILRSVERVHEWEPAVETS
jgi:hypothetical protein